MTEEIKNENTSIQNEQEEAASKEETPTSYAVRPHHRQRRLIAYGNDDNTIKLRNRLNILFMILAIVGLVLWTQTEQQTLAIIILLIGVALKIAEVCIRLFKK